MAKSKKPVRRRKKAKKGSCVKCGATTGGKATLCFACVEKESGLLDADSARKVAEKIKARLGDGDLGGPVCPFCRTPIDPDSLGVMEIESSIYVSEKIQFCKACRSYLGVSSWHPGEGKK